MNGRGTHVDGRVMEATTSHTPLVMHAFHHSSIDTHDGTHPHGCMTDERVDDHTVLTITSFIHPNHTVNQLCAGQHSHSTVHSCRLLSPLSKDMLICATRVPLQRAVLHAISCHWSAITITRANCLCTACHYLIVCVFTHSGENKM